MIVSDYVCVCLCVDKTDAGRVRLLGTKSRERVREDGKDESENEGDGNVIATASGERE